MCLYLLCNMSGSNITDFLFFFPGVLEGLGTSGRLIGTISTYPGTNKCPGSRVMAKNPPGGIFLPSTVSLDSTVSILAVKISNPNSRKSES